MKCFLLTIFIVSYLVVPVNAVEIEAPAVPDSYEAIMPDTNGNFANGLLELLRNVLNQISPTIKQGASACISVIISTILVSLLEFTPGSKSLVVDYSAATAIGVILFIHTNSMIQLTGRTIIEMSEYGKLLFPVMAAAMAAHGGITSSAALYAGATAFSSFLSTLISKVFLPMVYIFLGLSVANSVMCEDVLKNMRDSIKQAISWSLKIVLTIFTTYMSLTGVVSGTTDAVTLKATKVTISSVVPVVGGILSDASEAVLVSVGVAKNAAGIYGIFAVLAVFLKPFLQIGIYYLMLKTVYGLCGIFGTKKICNLIGDFSTAMGLLLAMTGIICVLLLIATICFMKGVG